MTRLLLAETALENPLTRLIAIASGFDGSCPHRHRGTDKGDAPGRSCFLTCEFARFELSGMPRHPVRRLLDRSFTS